MQKNYKWQIGIDEAGRGPLAGPVAVGCVKVAADFDWQLIPGVRDSKQLAAKNREAIFRRAWELQRAGLLQYSVSMSAASVIDSIGIVPAIRQSLHRALTRLESNLNFVSPIPRAALGMEALTSGNSTVNCTIRNRCNRHIQNDCLVLLDGGLKAPPRFVHQRTIIRGDASEKVIGLASILAKVTRDRYMVRKAAEPLFAPYQFHTHKGYATPMHRELISIHGLSPIHRASYCRNIISL